MSDQRRLTEEPESQLIRGDGDSSLILSKARSNLVARGRKDAAILAATGSSKPVNSRLDHLHKNADELTKYETEYEAWLIAEIRRTARQELAAVPSETQTITPRKPSRRDWKITPEDFLEQTHGNKPIRPSIASFQSWEEYLIEHSRYKKEFEDWLIFGEVNRIVRQELAAVQSETQTTEPTTGRPLAPTFDYPGSDHEAEYEARLIAQTKGIVERKLFWQ
jgi:hypothetical protein